MVWWFDDAIFVVFFPWKPHRMMRWQLATAVGFGGLTMCTWGGEWQDEWTSFDFEKLLLQIKNYAHATFFFLVWLLCHEREHEIFPQGGTVNECIHQILWSWEEARWWSYLPDSLWCFTWGLRWSLAPLPIQEERHQAKAHLVGSLVHQSLCDRRCPMLHGFRL